MAMRPSANCGISSCELRPRPRPPPGPFRSLSLRTVDDADVTVAAQRIGADGDPLAALGWVLLANEDLNAAKFAHDPVGRAAAVVSGLGAGITLALLGWIYVATVRPLRERSRPRRGDRRCPERGGPARAPRRRSVSTRSARSSTG